MAKPRPRCGARSAGKRTMCGTVVTEPASGVVAADGDAAAAALTLLEPPGSRRTPKCRRKNSSRSHGVSSSSSSRRGVRGLSATVICKHCQKAGKYSVKVTIPDFRELRRVRPRRGFGLSSFGSRTLARTPLKEPGGPRTRGPPGPTYGLSFASKMSVRFARLPSFAIPNRATNEFSARARPS
jgi:hypothetical protein